MAPMLKNLKSILKNPIKNPCKKVENAKADTSDFDDDSISKVMKQHAAHQGTDVTKKDTFIAKKSSVSAATRKGFKGLKNIFSRLFKYEAKTNSQQEQVECLIKSNQCSSVHST